MDPGTNQEVTVGGTDWSRRGSDPGGRPRGRRYVRRVARDPRCTGWTTTLPIGERVDTAPLGGDETVDVVIVGAGYTGLWSAYHLTAGDPELRVAVIDAGEVGAGASSRNGGWCSALLPMSLHAVAQRHGRDEAIRWQQTMHRTVDDVLQTLAVESIDADQAKGGTVTLARNPAQLARTERAVAEARSFGFGPDDVRLLDSHEASDLCRATSVLGGSFTPHCAAIHPARLVHGLARTVVIRGATIWSSTAATTVEPGAVTTERGRISADRVVLATEAYTARFADRHRDVIPLYSLMIATEPLGDDVWDEIGLRERQTFHDERHLIVYGQRTADGRLAFGGRGAPYHFGSRIADRFDTDERVRDALIATLHDLFPVLADVAVPDHWGGPLAVPRDHSWRVRSDPSCRLIEAGGYTGDGVAASYLAGRIVASTITGHDPDGITTLPVCGHSSRRWEPEPLRWIGINAARLTAAAADRAERREGSSVWARLFTAISGR